MLRKVSEVKPDFNPKIRYLTINEFNDGNPVDIGDGMTMLDLKIAMFHYMDSHQRQVKWLFNEFVARGQCGINDILLQFGKKPLEKYDGVVDYLDYDSQATNEQMFNLIFDEVERICMALCFGIFDKKE